MTSPNRAFQFEHHHKLDSDERLCHQPPEPLVELIAAAAPRVVADLGAGTGYFALPLVRKLPHARLIALDIETRMLELLARRATVAGSAGRVDCRLIADSPSLPLGAGEADVVLLASLWHELPDREGTLAELVRGLASDGRVVICDWSPDGSTEHGPAADHRIAVEVCERALVAAGWHDITRHAIYPHHWTITARRP